MALEPIKWKSKVVLAALRIDPDLAVVPSGAANAMLLTDVTIQPMEGEDVSRNLELAYLGGQEQVPVALRSVMTASAELQGSGTAGVPPGWAPLLRACAVVEVITEDTSVEYSPISEAHEMVDIHFWIGPSRQIFAAAKGTCVISMNAQNIPVARLTITGLWGEPSDVARPTIDTTRFQVPDVVRKANTPVFTIGGTAFKLRSYELNLGNDVQPRMLANYEGIVIVDRQETLTVNVEAVPYAVFNPQEVAVKRIRQAVVIEHGTVAGKKVRIEAGQAPLNRLSGFENNQAVLEWPLVFTPLPTDAGDDQWKITLT